MSTAVDRCFPIGDNLVCAVFNIDTERVMELLKAKEYNPDMLNNVCSLEGHLCPINWIPECWDIIMGNPNTWPAEYIDRVQRKKNDNAEIMRVLADSLGIDYTPIIIRDNDLWIYQFDMEDTYVDVFDCSKDEMLSRGYNELDIDLYYAVHRYDFPEVEKLLGMGANPKQKLLDDSWSLELIESRCAYYSIELGNVLLENEKRNPMYTDYRELGNLLAWAINEKMYNILHN